MAVRKTLSERLSVLEKKVEIIEKLEERRGQSMHSLIGDIGKLQARIDTLPDVVTRRVVEELRPQLVEEMRILRTELWEKMETFAKRIEQSVACRSK